MRKILTLLLLLPLALSAASGRGTDYVVEVDRGDGFVPVTVYKALCSDSAAHHPDRNFGTGIDKAPSQKETIKILYRKNISVFIVSFNVIDLVVINPGTAAFERAPFALLQNGFCVHISSQSAAWRLRKR